jgi:hypothetical protein
MPSLASAIAVAVLLSASCAAPIRVADSIDPLALLSKDGLAYARISGRVARDIAPEIMSAADYGQAKGLLERTRIIAAALGRGAGRDTGSLEAVLVGDYPFRAASLSMGSGGWRREEGGFYNPKLGLHAAVPGPSLVVAARGPVDALVAAAKDSSHNAPLSPIPERLSGLAARELVLWIPDPFKGLVAASLGEESNLPARGLIIAASPNAPADGEYRATIAFVMESPDSVRIFKPALKLAWYALSRALVGDAVVADESSSGAESLLRAKFEAKGELYVAEDQPLSRVALVAALKRSIAFGDVLGIGADGSSGGGASVPGR